VSEEMKAQLLQAANDLLRSLNAAAGLQQVVLYGRVGPDEIHLKVGAANSNPKGLRDTILDAVRASKGPLRGLAVARRCGHMHDSYFRTVLAAMVRQGQLRRCGNGYTAAEPREIICQDNVSA
jgi:hypothetical protein